MTYKVHPRNLLLAAASVFAVLTPRVASAQVNPMTTRTTPDQLSNQSGTGYNPAVARDRLFVHSEADAANAELQFSQLAVLKAASADVKAFATKIVNDRTASNSDLAPVLSSLGGDTPKKLAKGDQKELDKLNALSGADFDKEYLRTLSKQRQKDLSAYKSEVANGGSADAKSYASKNEHSLAGTEDELNKLMQVNGVTP